VVVGGLLFSQLVTLYLTLAFYTYLGELKGWWRKRKKVPAPVAEPVH